VQLFEIMKNWVFDKDKIKFMVNQGYCC
jgi:hypothetical protein